MTGMVCCAAGIHRSTSVPTIRAQAGRTTDAVELRETRAFISDGHAASKSGTHADVPGAAVQMEPGSELAETGAAAGPDLQPASIAGPERTGDEAVGEQLLEFGEAAAAVSGQSALARVKTHSRPASLGSAVLGAAGLAGQPKPPLLVVLGASGQPNTPSSHRISDVGSEPDELAAPIPSRLADAGGVSRPTTPTAAHLTPR